MPSRHRRSWLKTATRPVVLAAVMALLLGGCGTMLDHAPRASAIGGAGRMLPAGIGTKLDEAAVRKRAEADPFPTAAEAGLAADAEG